MANSVLASADAPGTSLEESASASQPHEQVREIAVYGHSSLLYWWPVWMVCFILAAVTYSESDHPTGMAVSHSNGPGLIFVFTLLTVALSSTVLLRGLISAIAVLTLISGAIAFYLFGWWTPILTFIGGLEIRINAAGYLCIGIPILVAWLLVIFVYDRMHYVIFGQGQIRYVLEVGDGVVVMPSGGAVVEKMRSDVFRHWMIGFGSGDITIRSGGSNNPAIQLKNIVGVRRKLVVIDELLREKAVVVS